MFAIVDILGFQERVEEGATLRIPSLDEKEGASVTFDKVLLVSKGKDDVTVGTPHVSGVTVEATVVAHGRDQKIRIFKMKRRKRYRRTAGHRQGYTDILVKKIAVGAAKAATKAAAAASKDEEGKKTEKKPATKPKTTKKA